MKRIRERKKIMVRAISLGLLDLSRKSQSIFLGWSHRSLTDRPSIVKSTPSLLYQPEFMFCGDTAESQHPVVKLPTRSGWGYNVTIHFLLFYIGITLFGLGKKRRILQTGIILQASRPFVRISLMLSTFDFQVYCP